MSINDEKTNEKIIRSAYTLFLESGISKTSLQEIAYHAGVSRMTVYRHFTDKEALVRAAFMNVEKIFQDALAKFRQKHPPTLERSVDILGNNLRTLPSGNVIMLADELMRVYPDVYAEIQMVRRTTLNGFFDQLTALADQNNLFREGLNREIAQAVFWELIINLFDNPRFKSLDMNDADLFYQMSHIFLYGVLKGKPESN